MKTKSDRSDSLDKARGRLEVMNGKGRKGKLTGGHWVTTDEGQRLYIRGPRPTEMGSGRPSLREQADRHRAGKGSVASRAESLMNRAANRGGELSNRASKMAASGQSKIDAVTNYGSRSTYSAMTAKAVGAGSQEKSQAASIQRRGEILSKRAAKLYEINNPPRRPERAAGPIPKFGRQAASTPARPSVREQADKARAERRRQTGMGYADDAKRKALESRAEKIWKDRSDAAEKQALSKFKTAGARYKARASTLAADPQFQSSIKRLAVLRKSRRSK